MRETDCTRVVKRLKIPAIIIWLFAALGVPYQFALQSTPNVMIPMLMHALNIGETSIGFITSGFFYTYLIFQIPAGICVDRFGPRRVLSGGILLAGLACLLFANSHHFAMAQCSRLIMGFVTASAVPSVMYVAAKRFPPSQFVILAGLAESIGMLGGAMGEALLGAVVMHWGWRDTMMLFGIVGFVLAILMFSFVRDSEDVDRPRSMAASTPSFAQILRGFACVMKSSQVWIIVFYGALIFAMLPALAGLWIVPTLQNVYHVGLATAALGSAVMFFGAAAGLPVWGFISERVQKRRPVLFFATLVNLLLTASFIFMRSPSLMIVFIQLFFMCFTSAVYVLAFALVRENTHECVRASAMGFTNMMTMIIGAPLLQPLIGAIIASYHQADNTHFMSPALLSLMYRHALSSVFYCVLLAFILIFFIRETHCKSQVSER